MYDNDCHGGRRPISLEGAWVLQLNHPWFPAAKQHPALSRKLSTRSTYLPSEDNWEKGGSNLLFPVPKSGSCSPVVVPLEMQGLGTISSVCKDSHRLRLVAADAKVLAFQGERRWEMSHYFRKTLNYYTSPAHRSADLVCIYIVNNSQAGGAGVPSGNTSHSHSASPQGRPDPQTSPPGITSRRKRIWQEICRTLTRCFDLVAKMIYLSKHHYPNLSGFSFSINFIAKPRQ